MTEKLSQRAVNYRDGTEKKCCGACSMFVAPKSCTDVRGPIRKEGLCNIYEAK